MRVWFHFDAEWARWLPTGAVMGGAAVTDDASCRLRHDRFITAAGVASFMERLGMSVDLDEMDAILGDADADNDGKVDFEDFVRIMAPPQGVSSRGSNFGRRTSYP